MPVALIGCGKGKTKAAVPSCRCFRDCYLQSPGSLEAAADEHLGLHQVRISYHTSRLPPTVSSQASSSRFLGLPTRALEA